MQLQSDGADPRSSPELRQCRWRSAMIVLKSHVDEHAISAAKVIPVRGSSVRPSCEPFASLTLGEADRFEGGLAICRPWKRKAVESDEPSTAVPPDHRTRDPSRSHTVSSRASPQHDAQRRFAERQAKALSRCSKAYEFRKQMQQRMDSKYDYEDKRLQVVNTFASLNLKYLGSATRQAVEDTAAAQTSRRNSLLWRPCCIRMGTGLLLEPNAIR